MLRLVICVCLCYLVSSQTDEVVSRPKIYYLHIKSDIRYRFSTTSVTSKVVNPSNESREALFDVTLPNEAFMTNLTLLINGTEYHGEVKEKKEAKQQYEKAKKLGQSAGIIKSSPRDTNKFQLQVNVAAEEKVVFELRYQELLRRVKGVYNHVIYVDPGEVVEDFKVEVAIEESRDITTLRVPPLRNDVLTDVDITATNKLAVIQRPSSKSVYIMYTPSIEDQEAASDQGLSGQFVVEYDVDRQNDAGELMVVNGYFVHFFAPSGMEPLPMDITFVLDTSGSMYGSNIKQLQTAMLKILDDIRPVDRFSIMTFESDISYWKPDLVSATDDNIELAKEFVRGITALGGTNINKALTEGLRLLSTQTDNDRAPVLIFLTDGQPTSGISNRKQILSNVRAANEVDIPIFSLAFGSGADYNFVKKVAAQNNGIARKIYTDSDASLQISGFYEEFSTIVLKDISFKYLGEINETTVSKQICYFGGSEIIVAGRMLKGSDSDVTPIVTGLGNGGKTINLVLPNENKIMDQNMKLNLTKDADFTKITEKMWAYLTIKELLKKKDALIDDENVSEINDEILRLSLKYNFVTPLTSMVVTLPDEIEAQQTDKVPNKGTPMNRPVFQYQRMGNSLVSPSGLQQNYMAYAAYKPRYLVSNTANVYSPGLRGIIQRLKPRPTTATTISSTTTRASPTTTTATTTVPTTQTSTTPITTASGSTAGPTTQKSTSTITTASGSTAGPTTQKSTSTITTTANTATAVPTTQKSTTPITTSSTTQNSAALMKNKKTQRKPTLLVKVPGISIPLCLNLPLKRSKTYQLLEETSTGKSLTATVQGRRSSTRLNKFRYPIFSKLSYYDKSGSYKETINLSNAVTMDPVSKNFTFQNLEVLVIQQGTDVLQLQGTFTSRSQNDLDGILGFFSDFSGRFIKRKVKGSRLSAKLKMKDGKRKIKMWASLLMKPTPVTDSCWNINKRYLNKLGIQLQRYEL